MTNHTTISISNRPDETMDDRPPSELPIGFLGIAGLIASAPTSGILRAIEALWEEMDVEPLILEGDLNIHPLGERLDDWHTVAVGELRRRAGGLAPSRSARSLRRTGLWAGVEEEIARRLDLVAFIAKHGGLRVEDFRPVGDVLAGPCSFGDHGATASPLVVDPVGKRWVCTGCGRGGDVFSFVFAWYDLQGRELVVFVAREVGLGDVALPEER